MCYKGRHTEPFSKSGLKQQGYCFNSEVQQQRSKSSLQKERNQVSRWCSTDMIQLCKEGAVEKDEGIGMELHTTSWMGDLKHVKHMCSVLDEGGNHVVIRHISKNSPKLQWTKADRKMCPDPQKNFMVRLSYWSEQQEDLFSLTTLHLIPYCTRAKSEVGKGLVFTLVGRVWCSGRGLKYLKGVQLSWGVLGIRAREIDRDSPGQNCATTYLSQLKRLTDCTAQSKHPLMSQLPLP